MNPTDFYSYDLIVHNTKSIILKQEKLKISSANLQVPLEKLIQSHHSEHNPDKIAIRLAKYF